MVGRPGSLDRLLLILKRVLLMKEKRYAKQEQSIHGDSFMVTANGVMVMRML